jgi:hypothetical protein
VEVPAAADVAEEVLDGFATEPAEPQPTVEEAVVVADAEGEEPKEVVTTAASEGAAPPDDTVQEAEVVAPTAADADEAAPAPTPAAEVAEEAAEAAPTAEDDMYGEAPTHTPVSVIDTPSLMCARALMTWSRRRLSCAVGVGWGGVGEPLTPMTCSAVCASGPTGRSG